MTTQMSLKKNDWIFHTGPWFRPLVSWVDESKYRDIPIFEFWKKCSKHLPFLLECKQILHPLLVLHILVALIWHPLLLRLSFVTLMILALWILRKIQNHLSQCRQGVQLGLYISDFCLVPTPNSWDDRCPLTTQKCTFLPFVLASSITSFLFLTFVSCHARIFSSFSHFLSTAAFASGIFIAWGIGINLCTRLQWFNELIPFPCNLIFKIFT